MHNIKLTEQIVETLTHLRELRHLDVSEAKTSSTFELESNPPGPHINDLLRTDDLFPHMTSLDLSG
jgi:hypothetical protein